MLATRGCLPFRRVEPLEWKCKTRNGKSVRRRILSWLPLRIERDLVALFLKGVRTGIFCDHTVSSVLYQRNSFGLTAPASGTSLLLVACGHLKVKESPPRPGRWPIAGAA